MNILLKPGIVSFPKTDAVGIYMHFHLTFYGVLSQVFEVGKGKRITATKGDHPDSQGRATVDYRQANVQSNRFMLKRTVAVRAIHVARVQEMETYSFYHLRR